ncbi:MAG: ABC transporter substrate-binding protein [Gammaproteobacteria bacterium]|nr:ABC transporter substrate-binding protein [Gammaproteobacteria bacterium]
MYRLKRFSMMLFCFCGFNILYADGGWVLNDPYPARESKERIYYSSFAEQPKTLDPARSYVVNELLFTEQIYEPALQYDYLKRPYVLVPRTLSQLPDVRYETKNGEVTASIYTIHVAPGIYYQPHPAFAKTPDGAYQYYPLPPGFLEKQGIKVLSDFKEVGTRELIADDYVYEIKRLANPAVNSPIYGLMGDYIAGFDTYTDQLPKHGHARTYLDLRQYPLQGAYALDRYTYEVRLKGEYPQFMYWLAMPFFAPIPWEADRFYSQPSMRDSNIGFGWYPVGTGPFMLVENNPSSRMVLVKNPHYREVHFPSEGSEQDKADGYLKNAGKMMPFIDKAVYTLEKEAIPRWIKFLQGYFDFSGLTADSFDSAVQITSEGEPVLTPEMRARGIRLTEVNEPMIRYIGFNMLDPIVGGKSTRARKLRQAIALAVNFEENIAIFLNGRGTPAQGPIPPSVFGSLEGKSGINPYVYTWGDHGPVRRPIKEARALMTEAGYPGGRDPKTGHALILHYDVAATGGPEEKAALNWMRKQFRKIGISLDVRATHFNRFQEKIQTGNAQIFTWGWIADYPDPENFLFLFYGPNARYPHGGENSSNYHNVEYDRLFLKMKNRANDAERQALINQMLEHLRHDVPWIFGLHGKSIMLSQQWTSPMKSDSLVSDILKYIAVDVPLRNQLRAEWNRPIWWPIGLFFVFCLLFLLPFMHAYYKRQRSPALRIEK